MTVGEMKELLSGVDDGIDVAIITKNGTAIPVSMGSIGKSNGYDCLHLWPILKVTRA